MKYTKTNKLQSEYYDKISDKNDNENIGYRKINNAGIVTKLWAKLRSLQQRNSEANNCMMQLGEFIKQKENIFKNKNILEIGCFSGSPFTGTLINLCSSYTGIELSSKAIVKFKNIYNENNEKIEMIHGDFELHEFNSKYDVIYCHGVLHHFKDYDKLLNKIYSILDKNGHLVFNEVSQFYITRREKNK